MSSHFFDLSLLGWDDSFELPAGTVPARVARVDRGAAEVIAADGRHQARYGARVRRASAEDPVALPCVGDWVALAPLLEGRYEVEAVLDRRTAFVRGGVGRGSRAGLSGDGQGQVLAANVDVVFVAEPAAHEPSNDRQGARSSARSGASPGRSSRAVPGKYGADLGRIERLVALAWESGGLPVVLITKADLLEQGLYGLLADVATAAPGVDVHPVCSITGEGVDLVRAYLDGSKTAVVLGPSGAGKSTLVNALAGTRVMDTQQVRAADGRGRHTTVHRELITLPGGGLIIDTPGIRRVGLYDMSDGVDLVFSDVEELAERCRFSDCRHEHEPGCAVLAAVASGELPKRRLESWHKLQREAAWMARRADARLRSEEARKWKIIHKELRRSGKSRP